MNRLALWTVLVGASLSPGLLAQDANSKVTGTVKFPAALESFDKGVLELILFKYNPDNLDEPAQRVERVEFKNISNREKDGAKQDFVLGEKGKLDPSAGYYVTALLYQDGKRTHIGELPGGVGLVRVLTDEKPRFKIEIIMREVRR